MSKRISVVGPIAPFAGYGMIVEQLVINFANLGYDPVIRASSKGESFGSKMDPEVKRRMVDSLQREQWEMTIGTPEHTIIPGKKTALFTMWECTRLSTNGLTNMQRCEVLITPSQWGSSCFSAQGLQNATFVVPLGYNPESFQYSPMNMEGPTVFGCGGRMAHGGARKGVNEVIEVFQKAFPTEKDVELRVKVFTDCPVKPTDDPRVKLYTEFLPEKQLAAWYDEITCFVSLARAEGWGLMQHQSMVHGRPVIACRYAGLAEFMTERNSYCVDYRQRLAKGFYADCNGKWAEWDEQSVIVQMKDVYKDRQKAARKGMEAADDVKHLTWENTAKETLKILRMVGAVQ